MSTIAFCWQEYFCLARLAAEDTCCLVCRVAGNVLDNNVLASMLYALTHLGSRLVIVMGHSKCGACNAAQGAYISAQGGGGSKGADPVSQLLAPIIDTCGHIAK